MTTIPEKPKRQRLTFDDTWQAVEWDLMPEYKGSMESAFHGLAGRSVKACDAVGVRRAVGQTPILLAAEFKDFDQTHLPADKRLEVARKGVSDDVMQAVISKLIDTLAGATFSHDGDGHRSVELESWRSAVGLKSTRLLVLVCVELPRSQALAATIWTTEIKRRLHWLLPRASVIVTSSRAPFSGLGVVYSTK